MIVGGKKEKREKKLQQVAKVFFLASRKKEGSFLQQVSFPSFLPSYLPKNERSITQTRGRKLKSGRSFLERVLWKEWKEEPRCPSGFPAGLLLLTGSHAPPLRWHRLAAAAAAAGDPSRGTPACLPACLACLRPLSQDCAAPPPAGRRRRPRVFRRTAGWALCGREAGREAGKHHPGGVCRSGCPPVPVC